MLLQAVRQELAEALQRPVSFRVLQWERDSYTEMLNEVWKQPTLDFVAGDITITENRSNYVDFTLPFFTSSASIVLLAQEGAAQEWGAFWAFARPFGVTVWLAWFVWSVVAGHVVWVLERGTLAFSRTYLRALPNIAWSRPS